MGKATWRTTTSPMKSTTLMRIMMRGDKRDIVLAAAVMKIEVLKEDVVTMSQMRMTLTPELFMELELIHLH